MGRVFIKCLCTVFAQSCAQVGCQVDIAQQFTTWSTQQTGQGYTKNKWKIKVMLLPHEWTDTRVQASILIGQQLNNR